MTYFHSTKGGDFRLNDAASREAWRAVTTGALFQGSPVLEAIAAVDVTRISATVQCEVDPGGSSTEFWFVSWRPNAGGALEWKIHPRTIVSGGQQQRLCIARALAIRPEVVLMDEPASALDPVATHKIEELIVELKKQYTIVIVTHNMQQAARVSDTTAFFLLGKLIEVNSTEIMFTNPTEKLTEDYITGRFG